MPKSTWTPEVVSSVTARYAAGETTYQIGQSYGVTPDWIAHVLKRAGVQLRPRGVAKKMTPEVHAKMLELYAANRTMAEIEREIGVSPALICRALKAASIEARPPVQRDLRQFKIVDGVETQVCRRCGERKALDLFSNQSKSRARLGRAPTCLRCDYFAHVQRTFGVTKEQFFKMLEGQEQCCAICRAPLDLSKRMSVHVDHDHKTGEVRALLCAGCNMGLGHFKDNPGFIKAAAAYLDRHQSLAPAAISAMSPA